MQFQPENKGTIRREEVNSILRRVGERRCVDVEDLLVPQTARGYQITDRILISHWVPAFNRDFLERFGVKSILALDGKLKPELAGTLGVKKILSFNMPDGRGTTPEMISSLVEQLKTLVDEEAPVLVQCNAGQSRSPAVVAAYLSVFEGMPLSESLRLVREARAPERRVMYQPEALQAIRKVLEAHGG